MFFSEISKQNINYSDTLGFERRKMCDEKHKQWINVKLLIKLKITLTECYELLKEVYGENSLSRVHVFEWYKGFLKAERALKMTNVLVNQSQLCK